MVGLDSPRNAESALSTGPLSLRPSGYKHPDGSTPLNIEWLRRADWPVDPLRGELVEEIREGVVMLGRMDRAQVDIKFVDPKDDSDENREIVNIAEQRSRSPRSNDRDLDHLISNLGFDPAKYSQG
jgi:hypothetical protein